MSINAKIILAEIQKQASFGGKRVPTQEQLEEAAKTTLEVVEFYIDGKRATKLSDLVPPKLVFTQERVVKGNLPQ